MFVEIIQKDNYQAILRDGEIWQSESETKRLLWSAHMPTAEQALDDLEYRVKKAMHIQRVIRI